LFDQSLNRQEFNDENLLEFNIDAVSDYEEEKKEE
jgi:hypothetical protein